MSLLCTVSVEMNNKTIWNCKEHKRKKTFECLLLRCKHCLFSSSCYALPDAKSMNNDAHTHHVHSHYREIFQIPMAPSKTVTLYHYVIHIITNQGLCASHLMLCSLVQILSSHLVTFMFKIRGIHDFNHCLSLTETPSIYINQKISITDRCSPDKL